MGAAITVTVAVAKEVFDALGITAKVFKTAKTSASIPDFLVTVAIPILVQLFNLYIL